MFSNWAKNTLALDSVSFRFAGVQPSTPPIKASRLTEQSIVDIETSFDESEDCLEVGQAHPSPSLDGPAGRLTHIPRQAKAAKSKDTLRQFIQSKISLRLASRMADVAEPRHRRAKKSLSPETLSLVTALSKIPNSENKGYLELVWADFPEFRTKHNQLTKDCPAQTLHERESIAILIHREFRRGQTKLSGVRFYLEETVEFPSRLEAIVAYYLIP
jgi:hypothetical protein